jgi:hypothetical protein
MDKNQKEMKGNHKTATHTKDDNSKGIMKGDKAPDMKADNKNNGAMKTEDKKASAAHLK